MMRKTGAINSLKMSPWHCHWAIDHWYFWCPCILECHTSEKINFSGQTCWHRRMRCLWGGGDQKTLTHDKRWFSCCRTAGVVLGHWEHSQAAEKDTKTDPFCVPVPPPLICPSVSSPPSVHSWATCPWLSGSCTGAEEPVAPPTYHRPAPQLSHNPPPTPGQSQSRDTNAVKIRIQIQIMIQIQIQIQQTSEKLRPLPTTPSFLTATSKTQLSLVRDRSIFSKIKYKIKIEIYHQRQNKDWNIPSNTNTNTNPCQPVPLLSHQWHKRHNPPPSGQTNKIRIH